LGIDEASLGWIKETLDAQQHSGSITDNPAKRSADSFSGNVQEAQGYNDQFQRSDIKSQNLEKIKDFAKILGFNTETSENNAWVSYVATYQWSDIKSQNLEKAKDFAIIRGFNTETSENNAWASYVATYQSRGDKSLAAIYNKSNADSPQSERAQFLSSRQETLEKWVLCVNHVLSDSEFEFIFNALP